MTRAATHDEYPPLDPPCEGPPAEQRDEPVFHADELIQFFREAEPTIVSRLAWNLLRSGGARWVECESGGCFVVGGEEFHVHRTTAFFRRDEIEIDIEGGPEMLGCRTDPRRRR